MTSMLDIDTYGELSTLLAELEEQAVLDLVRESLANGVESLTIIELCHEGMVEVGKRYEKGEYFISGLIMAGEIMVQVGKLAFPLLENRVDTGDAGSIVLGTVEGDIHFVGKDIFKVLIQGYGFTVHDLGIDVPASKFLDSIHELKPDILGISCLISSAYEDLAETIGLLKKYAPEDLSPRAYIIGGRVDEILRREVGADFWVKDGMAGVRLCQNIMGSVS
jgi:methanogenic corrinoid protein MtbC1